MIFIIQLLMPISHTHWQLGVPLACPCARAPCAVAPAARARERGAWRRPAVAVARARAPGAGVVEACGVRVCGARARALAPIYDCAPLPSIKCDIYINSL